MATGVPIGMCVYIYIHIIYINVIMYMYMYIYIIIYIYSGQIVRNRFQFKDQPMNWLTSSYKPSVYGA